MKVGIVGVGAVGTACAKSMLLRGSCEEIVLVDKDESRARGVAADLSHAAVLCPPVRVGSGGWADLEGCGVVAITAGINEKAGEATDRADELGRLRLLPHNAQVYREVVPEVARHAPLAVILVVTDPPDPLADIALDLTETNPVISAGTYLDSLRFQLQIAQRLGCHPASVTADVLGEHGTSQVYVWSGARVGGEAVADRVVREGADPDRFREEVEQSVRFANIEIIEGTGASQHGIGVVTARLAEAILRDEGLVAPVGTRLADEGVTLSLPSVIGRTGVRETVRPPLSAEESEQFAASAEAIREALRKLDRESG